MRKLYLMIGAPGSGKSTWIKNNMPKEAAYISRDEIRFAMVAEDEQYFSKEKQVYKEFIHQIDEALTQGKDVFVDQTSLNYGARQKLFNALTEKPSRTIAIYIKKPLDIILKYNAKRSGRAYVPEDAVINMYNSIQEPNYKEGFDWIYIVTHKKTTMKGRDNNAR